MNDSRQFECGFDDEPGRELPSRREAIEGTYRGTKAFAQLNIAKQLRKCPPCEGHIEIGSEYVLLNHVQPREGFDHHHFHTRCFRELVLPEFSGVRVVSPDEASATKMNKRRRRSRHQQRGR